MPTAEQITAHKQAREIAAELADLVLGETKTMSDDAESGLF